MAEDQLRKIVREELLALSSLLPHHGRYLTVEEAAAVMGIGKTLVYDLIKLKKLPAASWTDQGHLRIDIADIETYHRKQKALRDSGRRKSSHHREGKRARDGRMGNGKMGVYHERKKSQ